MAHSPQEGEGGEGAEHHPYEPPLRTLHQLPAQDLKQQARRAGRQHHQTLHRLSFTCSRREAAQSSSLSNRIETPLRKALTVAEASWADVGAEIPGSLQDDGVGSPARGMPCQARGNTWRLSPKTPSSQLQKLVCPQRESYPGPKRPLHWKPRLHARAMCPKHEIEQRWPYRDDLD